MSKGARTETVTDPIQPSSAKLSEDEYIGIRNRLEVELIDKLTARASWGIGILGTLVAGLGFAGANVIIQQTVTSEVRQAIESEKENIGRFRSLVTDSLKEAAAVGAQAKATLAKVEEASTEAQETLEKVRATMEAANQRAIEITQRWTIDLSKPFDRDTGVLKDTAITDQALTSVSSNGALTETDKRAIIIRQSPRDTGETTPDGRKIVELTFSLDVDTGTGNKSKTQIMAQVEKVEYGFDERWFEPATKIVESSINDFRYRINVWGITRVKAAVYLKNPPELLLFGGSMNLTGAGTLGTIAK